MSATERCAACAISIAASSPKRSRRDGRLNQSPLTKPPLRPLGPSPQTSVSHSTTRASGRSRLRCHAVHSPVYPPPTTSTSALTSERSGGRRSTGSASASQ